mgnify:FL=1
MIEIVPAILTKSPDEFKEMLRAAEPYFLSVHLDIADGVFVPNTTIKGPEELASVHTPLKITVHLMVSKPEGVLGQWLDAAIESLIFHLESTNQMDELINKTRAGGKKVGIAINPDTPIESIMPFADKVDFVHFMTVNPGFYGSEFKEEVLNKIKNFNQKYPDIKISVDGGVDLTTARKLVESGVDVLIAGSYFFRQGRKMDEALENMKKSIY